MAIEELLRTLAANREVFKGLLEDVSPALQSWRPRTGSWNLLEILCHLIDEEQEDFRARTRLALLNGSEDLVSINPVGWVLDRDYGSRDYATELIRFVKERDISVNWLRSLKNPHWSASFYHDALGKMTASKMLANWLAHDYLHIRQITAIKYDYLREFSGEDLSYAGNWRP